MSWVVRNALFSSLRSQFIMRVHTGTNYSCTINGGSIEFWRIGQDGVALSGINFARSVNRLLSDCHAPHAQNSPVALDTVRKSASRHRPAALSSGSFPSCVMMRQSSLTNN